MSKCMQCGTENPDAAKFCSGCGTSINTSQDPREAKCAACGTANPADAKFCRGCGTAMEVVPQPPQPELACTQFCTNCGSQLAPDSRFCHGCGTSVQGEGPVAPNLVDAGAEESPARRYGVMACAALVVAAFFMPWVTVFGVGASAFEIAKLGSAAVALWLLPALAFLALALAGGDVDTRWTPLFCGAVPFAALAIFVAVTQQADSRIANAVSAAILHTATIGFYLTLLGAAGMVAFASRTVFDFAGVVVVVVLCSAASLFTGRSYTDYSARAKMSEVLLAGAACRTTITEMYMSGTARRMRPNGWSCEGPPPTRYVRSISTDANGRIFLLVQNVSPEVDGKAVTLYPADLAGRPLAYAPGLVVGAWVCGGEGTTVPLSMLPGSCRGAR